MVSNDPCFTQRLTDRLPVIIMMALHGMAPTRSCARQLAPPAGQLRAAAERYTTGTL